MTEPSASLRGVFRCPLCGSPHFRTDLLRSIGECKGQLIERGSLHDYTGCIFTWPRSDDALYFERVGDGPT